MKLRLEIDPSLAEEEVVIRCPEITPQVAALQQQITDAWNTKKHLICFEEGKDYYIPMEEILFLETDGGHVRAHTAQQIYQVQYRLYELEEILPGCFVRISKSTILNIHHVRSILKNITGASEVEFDNCSKHAYVSRSYYKILRDKLENRR